jgi:ankyrin repeat protein
MKFIIYLTVFIALANSQTKNDSLFIDFINQNKLDEVKKLVRNGVNINGFKDYQIPLILASQKGFYEIAETLIAANANVNILNKRGSTPLMMATYYGQKSVLNLLLNNKADVSYVSESNGYRAFDWALENNQVECLSILINAWLKVLYNQSQISTLINNIANDKPINSINIKSIDKKALSFVLNYCLTENKLSIFKELVSMGADINSHNQSAYAPLALASRLGKMEFVIFMIEKANANVNIGNDGNDEACPLIQAARGGQLEIGKYLISKGADVNKKNGRGYTALSMSINYNRPKFTQLLIQNGANPQIIASDLSTPLETALLNYDTLALRLIFKYSVLNSAKSKLEHDAVKNDNFAELDLQKNPALASALLNYAAYKNDTILFNILISKKVNLNIKCPLGYYPLSVAAFAGNKSIVKLCLKEKVDVNATNSNQYITTALIESSRSANIEIANLLLQNGADINKADKNNDHVLNWATFFGLESYVTFLLNKGIKMDLIGSDSNDNSLDIAIRMNFKSIETELIKRGAKSAK